MTARTVTASRTPALGAAAPRRPGPLRRRFGKYLALGQYGFPFVWAPCPTPVSRLRALARRGRFVRNGPSQIAGRLAMTLLWPFGALSTALRMRAQMAARGAAPRGPAVVADMVWLALRHSIPPMEYALYGFQDPARRADMHHYVYWNDLPGLGALVRRAGADGADVQDKDRFAEICAAHGLAHVPTLAVFTGGRQRRPDAPFRPDAPALWVKALRLKGGAGAMKWTREGEAYRNTSGRAIPAADLAADLCSQDCLVQPVVENHGEIAAVSNGALASLRIVTGMDRETGRGAFVAALLTLPHGEWTTSVAGIMCALDTKAGRIRRAAMPGGEAVEAHPDTGAPVAGRQIPFWRESLELCLQAHAEAFPKFPFLGWDVALTPDGPVLLEANSGWGAIFHQMMDGPLGRTEFSRLVSQYV